MRTLHELPRFEDRWSYLYAGLRFHNLSGETKVPIDQASLVMLGPGSTITHAIPHACGGEPYPQKSQDTAVQYSPRVWG